ncbi:hypothetical protein A9P79_28505 (plasmid) [Cupriavidus taiwanensis]|nr:hypothetical protein A9P79_28030 [Cupriavidus taiwanensis]ULX55932.1 hypothetical protein A9P79_28505 [Cupriavidus taiwanensis]
MASTQGFDHCLYEPNVSLAAFQLERYTVGQLCAQQRQRLRSPRWRIARHHNLCGCLDWPRI